MRDMGLIRGAGPESIIILGATGPENGPLRFADEYVRHKVLDLIGDLALAGRRIEGHVVAERAGHAMHTALVSRLIKDRSAWELAHVPVAAEPAKRTASRSGSGRNGKPSPDERVTLNWLTRDRFCVESTPTGSGATSHGKSLLGKDGRLVTCMFANQLTVPNLLPPGPALLRNTMHIGVGRRKALAFLGQRTRSADSARKTLIRFES